MPDVTELHPSPTPLAPANGSGPIIHPVSLDPRPQPTPTPAAAPAEQPAAQPALAVVPQPAAPTTGGVQGFFRKAVDFAREHKTPLMTVAAALGGMEYERRRQQARQQPEAEKK